MALYEMREDAIRAVAEVTFAESGVRERADLQRLLRSNIEVIAPETMIIAEEFGDWTDSRRRIDLLGIDCDANLVVIELKRTDDGGHMELQSLRYAAMISAMTFEKVVDIFGRYLKTLNDHSDARQKLLDFLDWEEPDEDHFAQQVRIVLASADFSKELTTTVIWLNECGLDIRCIRVKPYSTQELLFLDVQQIIPLPEAMDYTIQIKEKQKQERASREKSLDFTKYDVIVCDQKFTSLPKRRALFQIVRQLCNAGLAPETISDAAGWNPRTIFRCVDGYVTSQEFILQARAAAEREGRRFEDRRFYCGNEYLIQSCEKTYAFTNQWGLRTFLDAVAGLTAAFPEHHIEVSPVSP